MKPRYTISFHDKNGTLVELEGSLPSLASQLADREYDGPAIRALDDVGFTRGWVRANGWRSA